MFPNKNIEISSMDIGGNYDFMSTKFSEIFLLNGD